MDLSDRLATKNLVKRGSLKVGPEISAKRAQSLITQELASPSQLDPAPKTIYPTDKARLIAAEPTRPQ